MLWTALRYCLSCLDVTPGTGDAMVCLPPVWWRSRVLQAQQLPPLLAMSSKPFHYYATFFPPSAHLGLSCRCGHSSLLAGSCSPHASLLETVLKGIWPLVASYGSLSAWVMTDHHTLAGYNDPRSVRPFVRRIKEPHSEL